MEIKDCEKYCIITPLSPKLSEYEVARLGEEISMHRTKKIGIDMSVVKDCTIDFVTELCKNHKIALFNLQSDIFALLLSMNMDKTIPLFVSEMDFIENKHQLLNRKFCIV